MCTFEQILFQNNTVDDPTHLAHLIPNPEKIRKKTRVRIQVCARWDVGLFPSFSSWLRPETGPIGSSEVSIQLLAPQRCLSTFGIDGKPTWRGGGVFTYGNMEILTKWTITMNIPWFTAGICEIRNPSLANLALQQLGLVGHLDALPSEVFGARAFPAIWGLDSESHRVSQSTAQHRTKRLKCVEERKQAKSRSYILFYSTNWGLFS